MLLYDVSQNKHDAYIYNVTTPTFVPHKSSLHLSCLGEKENAILSFFNNQELAFMQLSFNSYIKVDPDMQDALIEQCSNQDVPTLLSNMLILQ